MKLNRMFLGLGLRCFASGVWDNETRMVGDAMAELSMGCGSMLEVQVQAMDNAYLPSEMNEL